MKISFSEDIINSEIQPTREDIAIHADLLFRKSDIFANMVGVSVLAIGASIDWKGSIIFFILGILEIIMGSRSVYNVYREYSICLRLISKKNNVIYKLTKIYKEHVISFVMLNILAFLTTSLFIFAFIRKECDVKLFFITLLALLINYIYVWIFHKGYVKKYWIQLIPKNRIESQVMSEDSGDTIIEFIE